MKEKVELEIEVVSVEDAEALIEYTKKVGKETNFLSFGEEGLELSIQQEELYIQSVLESENQMMLLAKLGQEIIAVASIGGNSKEKFQHVGELGISILKEYWGQGLGSALMEELLSWAKDYSPLEKIKLAVVKENVTAIALYKKFGFKVVAIEEKEMKVGIIAAMEEEKRLLSEEMTIEQEVKIAGWTFLEGTLNGVSIVLVQSGIGKVMSSVTAALLIHHFNVTLVINTGSAGGFGTEMNIGDIVVATELAYSDADVTAFQYEYGQMPGMPARFQAQVIEDDVIEEIQSELKLSVFKGLVVSADSFIHREDQRLFILKHFPDVLATEMEGASIAQACYALQTPVIVVRAISDMPEKGTSAVDFDTFIVEAGRKSALIVHQLLHHLKEA